MTASARHHRWINAYRKYALVMSILGVVLLTPLVAMTIWDMRSHLSRFAFPVNVLVSQFSRMAFPQPRMIIGVPTYLLFLGGGIWAIWNGVRAWKTAKAVRACASDSAQVPGERLNLALPDPMIACRHRLFVLGVLILPAPLLAIADYFFIDGLRSLVLEAGAILYDAPPPGVESRIRAEQLFTWCSAMPLLATGLLSLLLAYSLRTPCNRNE